MASQNSPPEPLRNSDDGVGIRDRADGLWSTSFVALLIVQFCSALNDNAFRWIVVPIAKPLVGEAAALAIGLAGFTLPFLICASPAGYLADRFSKARVITAFRIIEAIVLGLGLAAIPLGNTPLLFGVVMATGALTALFTPSKLGSLPEIVRDSELSTANGLMGLMVVVPAALGLLIGNGLSVVIQPQVGGPLSYGGLGIAASIIMSVALVGWVASLFVHRHPPADPNRKWSWNLIGDTKACIGHLIHSPELLQTACGITFFWMLAALAQINIDTFGIHDLGLTQQYIGVLGMTLVLGVGIGSVLAGLWSAGHIELGLVPLGALGILICSTALYVAGLYGTSNPDFAFYASCIALFGLGTSAGLFDVPLETWLQHRSHPAHLGEVIAATNVLVFSGVLLVSGLFYVLRDDFGLRAGTIFLIAGLATIPVGIYIATQMPSSIVRLALWLFTHLTYRMRIVGRENVPLEGGVLLMPNHITWVDGILLQIASPRPIRFIVYSDYVNHPRLGFIAKMFDMIPIKADGGPKALIQSLKVAREALQAGQCVCIFAEGTLTRTGQMQPFQSGFLKILQGTGAPVVPVCLHGLWGSIFSYRGGKFFRKWPRAFPYPISILYGKPMSAPESPDVVSQAVRHLAADAVERNKPYELTPPRMFLRTCRSALSRPKIADSSGVELTGGKLLASTLAFRSVLIRSVLTPGENYVGILLPPTVGCALANLALSLSKRAPVNLNYTMSEADLRFCVKEAGIKHVITSRKMLEKKPVDLGVEWVFLEDLKEQITTVDRLLAGIGAYATPLAILERSLGLLSIHPDDVITCIFTSGSTGEPKGVLLSHHNIRATVDAADHLFQVESHDVVLGVLPIFHSLGYLATLWLPMGLPAKVVYHVNPLDARQIGELSEKHGGTILFATPTFLRTYLKRCTPEQFSKLDLVVVGAEKLSAELADQFQTKFKVLPTEGYGATETTGPAAVNVPDHRCEMVTQIGTKLGTVGRAMPGVVAQVVDPDSRQPLGVGQEGLLLVRGANVMLGYLNRPEKTAGVIQDGWYNTGDMAIIDTEGFIQITGRMSRFSKIGGEMVPHIKIEESLLGILETPDSEDSGPLLAVTSVPDEKKGERLIVLHRPLSIQVGDVLKALAAKNLPNLWLPDHDAFIEVPQIPLLGTGKFDLRAIKQLALERTTLTPTTSGLS